MDIHSGELPLVPPDGGEGTGHMLFGYNFHADERWQGDVLAPYFQAHPIEGVELYEFHPEAAKVGERYLGPDGQMSKFFPGNVYSSNPEEAAAGKATAKIIEVDPWLVPVLHDAPNQDYLVVGPMTSPAALGLACELGIEHVMVSSYPFSRVVPRALNLEILPNAGPNTLSDPEHLHKLMREAVNLGEAGLTASFREKGRSLSYYHQLAAIVINEVAPEVMADLEALKLTPKDFESVELPPTLLETLLKQLRGDAVADAITARKPNLAAGTWNYNNFSDGKVFGALLLKIDAPEGDDWLRFQDLISLH